MDLAALKKKTVIFINKYKYVAIVIAIGLILMVLPNHKTDSSKKETTIVPSVEANTNSITSELASVLSKIDGAGAVDVMLSVSRGEETIYQTNTNTSEADNTSQIRVDTVTVTDAQRNELGLIRQINPPVYLGALVICQGADAPTVRLAIVEAVSKITGLGADRISVLKMK